MKRFALLPLLGLALLTTTGASPYSGMEDRAIKALSPERIEELRSGAGAGYALAAELNGYPGPRHVLDLARDLDLTPQQTAATQDLFDKMKAEVVPLGAAFIEQERRLDALFRDRAADEAEIARLTAEIGAVEARLRAAHLKYHLAMPTILTPHQVARYDSLRGYTRNGGHGAHRH